MIAPMTAPVEWWYDLARDVDALGMEDAEGVDVLTAGDPLRRDEGVDDEIARAAEELQSDEG
jgi:hypothetical protein